MSLGNPSLPLSLCAVALSVPESRIDVCDVLEQERVAYEAQLLALSPSLRQRLEDGLGIRRVITMGAFPSPRHAEIVARRALDQAGIDGRSLGLIVDFSTLAADTPEIWSLAHHLQGLLGAPNALALSTRGSGCAGLHVALMVTQALMVSHPQLQYALLVASDRAPDGGRCCLPISIMADSASAIVVARPDCGGRHLATIHGVIVEQCGKLASVLRADRTPLRMTIDGTAFERQVLPVHFVMLYRLLSRLTRQLGRSFADISAYVYPNTTELDRRSVARSFGITPELLVGPGPVDLGHAFASDLLINAESWLTTPAGDGAALSAWLASGSGFTWGAALVERDA